MICDVIAVVIRWFHPDFVAIWVVEAVVESVDSIVIAVSDVVDVGVDVHVAVPVGDVHGEVDILRTVEGEVVVVPSVPPGRHRVVVLQSVVASNV